MAINVKYNLIYIIVALFAAFIISTAFDLMISRAVIGFVLLSFVPGYLVLKSLNIDTCDITETSFFSMGLGLVFLMFVGILTSQLAPFLGVAEPLSTIPLVLVLSVSVFSLVIICFFRNKSAFALAFSGIESNIKKYLPAFGILLLLPVLSIMGALVASYFSGTNIVYIVLFIGIALLLALSCFRKVIPSDLFPLFIFVFSLSLLFSNSLYSPNINGFDIQHEYRFMETTFSAGQWFPDVFDKFSSLLSVTILPVEFWQFMGIDGIWVSKIIYPFIFAFVPVVSYKVYRLWLSKNIAFLASFFLVANSVFFTEMTTLGRQMIAELFLVILLFVLFSKNIKNSRKFVLFALFSFAMVVSHYAIAEIFLFLIGFSWFMLLILKKNSRRLNLSFVLIFAVIMFGWYIYIASGATFSEFTEMFDYVYRSTINNFFDFSSRGDTVLLGLGIGNTPTTWVNLLGRVWAYAAELLLVVGYLLVLLKPKIKFEKTYLVILSICMLLLILSIVLPSFAARLGMSRLYQIILIFAAPLMVIGTYSISDFIFKSKKNASIILSLIILIPFFFFQTGVFYELSQSQSYSIPLSRYRFDASEYSSLGLLETTDVFGVQWLSLYQLNGSAKIFSDNTADSILVRGGYGLFPVSRTQGIISNVTMLEQNSFMYLRYYNLKFNLLPDASGELNTTDYYNLQLTGASKVYSNGYCDIYYQ
jgi:uncharacterized membrane protein